MLIREMKRRSDPTARAGLALAFALLAIVIAIESADGPDANYIGLLAGAPFLAAAFARWREVLVVGGVAALLGILMAMPARAGTVTAHAVNVGGVIVATGMAALVSLVRQRQTER